MWFRPSQKEVAVDISTLQPVRQPESCNLLLDSCLVITMGKPCCPMIPLLCFLKWPIVLLWFLYAGFMRNRWRTNYPMDIIQSPVRISSRQYIIHSKGTALSSLWGAEGTICSTSYVASVGIDHDWSVGHWIFFSILQESKITREEMVRKMMIIVGKEILLEALDKLHYCVSL